jgi:hypothetical protein
VTDVLARWNEGSAKQAILDFIASATQPGPGRLQDLAHDPARVRDDQSARLFAQNAVVRLWNAGRAIVPPDWSRSVCHSIT